MADSGLRQLLAEQLGRCLERTELGDLLPAGTERYQGKVRDNYTLPDGRRIIAVSDRLSAFDVVLGAIPFKGQVLNQMAAYWFEKTADIAENHLLAVPDPNVTVARQCQPLPVEFVMRAYLTGTTETSIWRAYERGERSFCGHSLADGMVRHQKLPEPLLTPSTKAASGGHDESVSRETLLERGVISKEHFEAAAAVARSLFQRGQKLAAERGLILVDTKYEMGLSEDGRIVVIDEIHTPDSSRYWYASDYQERMASGRDPRSLDKEFVRRYLVTKRGYRGDGPPPQLPDDIRIEAAARYIEIFELVTGRAFEPDRAEPGERIRRNLSEYLAGPGGGEYSGVRESS